MMEKNDSPRIALVEMTSGIDAAANLSLIDAAMAEAAVGGAVMAFLPEMSVLLDRDRARSDAAIVREQDSVWLQSLCNMARRHGLWLHTGSMPLRTEDGAKRLNRSHVIDCQGEIRARYDKIHMFDVDLPTGEKWSESSSYQGGDSIVVVDTPIGRLGLTICYDLRFPELFRALVNCRATIIAVPAAFTVPTGEAHWNLLLRARAVETGCHIIAAAQAGKHADGRVTYGHSLVADPWGNLLSESDATSDRGYRLLFAHIDAADVAKARHAIPLERSRAMRLVDL